MQLSPMYVETIRSKKTRGEAHQGTGLKEQLIRGQFRKSMEFSGISQGNKLTPSQSQRHFQMPYKLGKCSHCSSNVPISIGPDPLMMLIKAT